MDAEKLELPPPVSDLKRFAGADCVPTLDEGAEVDELAIESAHRAVLPVTPHSNANYSRLASTLHLLVPRLLIESSPPTVFGGVVTIVIPPIDRVGWGRLRTHILSKLAKRSSPLGTDFYPSPPIPVVCGVSSAFTPVNHSLPYKVGPSTGHSMGLTLALWKWYTFLNVHNDLVNQKWMGSIGYSRYSHTLT